MEDVSPLFDDRLAEQAAERRQPLYQERLDDIERLADEVARLRPIVEVVARLYPQVRESDPDDGAVGHLTFGLIRQAHAALGTGIGRASDRREGSDPAEQGNAQSQG